jgi:hypothetical protein
MLNRELGACSREAATHERKASQSIDREISGDCRLFGNFQCLLGAGKFTVGPIPNASQQGDFKCIARNNPIGSRRRYKRFAAKSRAVTSGK